jgi:hypothetical protein
MNQSDISPLGIFSICAYHFKSTSIVANDDDAEEEEDYLVTVRTALRAI